jgi:phosphate-selective porin OprO/OprP
MNGFRDRRGTWAVGLYDEDGTQATARLTALPIWADEGQRYLHFGFAVRYNSTDSGQLRFSGRPESNVTDLYVDTGNIAADHAWHAGLEALWADGPYSVLGEVVEARVSSNALGDPTFTGWYVTGKWTVTGGGPRPYDRNVAYARRMPVTGRHGEVELVARIGRVDLDDAAVSGGTMEKWYVGVNWWATKRWRATLGYGDTDLGRFGFDGNTKILLTRLQWIY